MEDSEEKQISHRTQHPQRAPQRPVANATPGRTAWRPSSPSDSTSSRSTSPSTSPRKPLLSLLPKISPATLPTHHITPQYASSVPRRYYRSRVVTGALFSLVLVVVCALTLGVNRMMREDVGRMPLSTELSLLNGQGSGENATGTEEKAMEQGQGEGEVQSESQPVPTKEVLPPLYPEYSAYEESLLQHHTPLAPGKSKKYINFANHLSLLGFNNHLEEYLLNAHLAFLTNRSLVFHEYTWNSNFEVEPYSEWSGKKIPSRVPESAMLGGWLGGSVRQAVRDEDEWDVTPVTRPYFEKTCPEEERVYVSVDEFMGAPMETVIDIDRYPEVAGKLVKEGTGLQIMQAWVERLQWNDTREARCVELRKESGHVFDMWLFGSPSLHTIWPSLAASPILEHWSFSPLIYEAFRRNAVERGLLGTSAKRIVELESANATREVNVVKTVDGIGYDAYGYSAYPGERPLLPMFTPPVVDGNQDVGTELSLPFVQRRVEVLPYPRTPQPSRTMKAHGSRRDAETLPILVLHLRRGDFEGHCKGLEWWGAAFKGFATFDEFEVRDKFVVPLVTEEPSATQGGDEKGSEEEKPVDDGGHEEGLQTRDDDQEGDGLASSRGVVKIHELDGGHIASDSSFTGHAFYNPQRNVTWEEKDAIYSKHCYPSTEQIVARVREVVEDWVGRRFVVFVEDFERSAAGARAEADAEIEVAYRHELEVWKQETMGRLKAVYLMTNGDRAWAAGIRDALRGLVRGDEDEPLVRDEGGIGKWKFHVEVDVEAQRRGVLEIKKRILEWVVEEWPWDAYHGDDGSVAAIGIASARDLDLTPEEKYVAQAVDMYIGQRAELLIGNGFSSMTANVMMLRKNAGLDPIQSRLW